MEVSWLPPQTLVDHYNVYGVTDAGEYVFLATSIDAGPADVLVAAVDAGYHAYAVSAVSGGVESPRTITPAVPCLSVTTSPPDVSPNNCRVVVIVPR